MLEHWAQGAFLLLTKYRQKVMDQNGLRNSLKDFFLKKKKKIAISR